MTSSPYDRDRLLDLAADYLDGAGSREDTAVLEALLRTGPAARAEFVCFAMLHGQLSLATAAFGPDDPTTGSLDPPRPAAVRRSRQRRVVAVAAGIGVAAAGLALILFAPAGSGRQTAAAGSYDDRQLPLVTVASLRDGADPPRLLTPSTLRPNRETMLRSTSGADVSVAKEGVFGMTGTDSGTLYDGRVRARLAEPTANFAVTTANLRIVDKGTAFTVERIDDDHVAVTVTDGEVEVQSRVRLPVCYWPFDEPTPTAGSIRVADVVGGLTATLDGGARRVAGLVGGGALRFDNTPSAAATIVGGTGDKVGTGLLALTEGVTIEAVIMPEWSGRFRDYDEIYRKEDGNSRVLLSFQHDGPNLGGYSEPEVPAGPCLAFGLHLAAHGYRELDMPLDGIDGRPTLAELTDGRPHHVCATFDSFTGRKAIFIDGRRRFSRRYPVGTMILSGGPVAATIGNHGRSEPFTGTIDELAIYDFALTPDEIAAHWRGVTAGHNYFESRPPAPGNARWQAVTRLIEGQTMTFNRQTGLPR